MQMVAPEGPTPPPLLSVRSEAHKPRSLHTVCHLGGGELSGAACRGAGT